MDQCASFTGTDHDRCKMRETHEIHIHLLAELYCLVPRRSTFAASAGWRGGGVLIRVWAHLIRPLAMSKTRLATSCSGGTSGLWPNFWVILRMVRGPSS